MSVHNGVKLSAVGLVVLTPRDCICPSENYTCEVNAGILIRWLRTHDHLQLSVFSPTDELYNKSNGYQVTLRKLGAGNYTSTLHVMDLGLNGSNLTCQRSYLENLKAVNESETISICVAGSNSVLIKL